MEPAAAPLPSPCFQLFRSTYYTIGLCLQGHAELQVNLDTYQVQAGSLLVLPAHCLKQWRTRSADFVSRDVLFTANFMAPAPGGHLGQFAYFESAAAPVLPLPPALFGRLQVSLEQLHQSYHESHLYRTELLQSRLRVLLYETAAAYAALVGRADPGQSRAQLLTRQFKHLLCAHCTTERHLAFYASHLYITPKHLTETIRAVTGRGAASLIAEAVTLEARLLLQNPALTVAQIADQLHFADQSAFARYFRHTVGRTPTTYRQQLTIGSKPFSDFLPTIADNRS
ncbi:AraC family transcriptional regulator [Hymenobacter bucti]|uniref:AraC family transcriptional regulator n=1 Tax=Hymenobacter bucti TaxID=1844114 RepID=UPI0036D41028